MVCVHVYTQILEKGLQHSDPRSAAPLLRCGASAQMVEAPQQGAIKQVVVSLVRAIRGNIFK